MSGIDFDVVIPTVGRPSLCALLEALRDGEGPRPGRILVVRDDGPPPPDVRGLAYETIPGPGRGPAAARNAGWRAAGAEWIAFLDDDVVPGRNWLARLTDDLAAGVDGSQGRIVVPLPGGRPPTDWERNVAGLERARWATADMAYRRTLLDDLGGFDERFRRAYREDAELALRAEKAGYRLARGARCVVHPILPAGGWVSVAAQRGNADDVLLERLHPGWQRQGGDERGRRPRHVAVTAAGLAGLAGLALGRHRLARAGVTAWFAGTAELAWSRIAPGPRDAREVLRMGVTSAVLPAAATAHWLAGQARWRRVRPVGPRPQAVLFDRDGTLVVDVPYNDDPGRVVPMPGARGALDRLRAAGVRLGAVSNQSGVGRGLLTMEQVERVNRRVEELLGPFGVWAVCPHAPDDGCACRKPAAGLVLRAAADLGVDPRRCVVVGDIGADVRAAAAAGARAILVPTERTEPAEVAAAPVVAATLPEAVELLLQGRA